ncbi:MAG TPA: hypothetical protein VFY87_15100 [Geminicoccaceae bacterium]|nr:hypothetical protein [Geminicoccaceae bacterium]
MLAILDAHPDMLQAPELGQLNHLEQAVANIAGTPIGKVTAQLSPLVRRTLGRPRLVFGLTPLLIFCGASG